MGRVMPVAGGGMPRQIAWRLAVALVVAGLVGAVAAPAAAAVLWTLGVSPLTATQHQATTFTVTATNLNLLDELGCVQVDLPASFSIVSMTTPQASDGEDWLLSRNGQAVVVQANGDEDRLGLAEWVRFTVRATPQQAGAFTWSSHGHGDLDCGDGDMIGVPAAVTVLPGAATPTPQPTPTATPNPTPTPMPTPPLPLPTLLPSLPPLPTLLPSLPLASETPAPTDSPRPTLSTEPSGSPGTDPSRPASPGPGDFVSGPGPSPDLVALPPDITSGPRSGSGLTVSEPDGAAGTAGSLRVAPFSLLTGIGAWVVPAAVIGGSGLLVLLFVGLQVAGAAIWLPAVRRLRGEAPGSG